MKRAALFTIILFVIVSTKAQVGIGTNTPDASAELDISSTTKGALIPRMTSGQRTGISSPATGLLVYQTDGSSGFYYYTGSAWTNLTSGGSAGVPTGTVMPYAGTTAPSGWLLCDGSAYSSLSATYQSLFAVIGTNYGGNGDPNFNVPDLRGRVIYGKDNMGGTAANRLTNAGGGITGTTLGATGGSQSKTLTTNELPSHNHTFTGSSVNTSSDAHTHTYNDAYFAEAGGNSSYGGNSLYGTSANTDTDNNFRYRTSSNGYSTSPSSLTTSSDSHNHTVTAAGTISNTGSGNAFSIISPGIVLNYIIKL